MLAGLFADFNFSGLRMRLPSSSTGEAETGRVSAIQTEEGIAKLSRASDDADSGALKIEVQLSGEDGNAFAIMGSVQRALAKNGVSEEEIEQYVEQSMQGNYDELLRTAGSWVKVS